MRLLCGPTHLMATLVFDPFNQDLFEHWYYGIFHHEDQGGLPAAVPNTHETDGWNGLLFYDL